MSSSKIYSQLLCCFFVLVCLARDATSRGNEFCYADRKPYIYSGALTAYQFIHNDIAEGVTLPNCKPIYIWMFCRHGTRYPSGDTIAEMLNSSHIRDLVLDNHKIHKRGHLCDKDLQNLENWSFDNSLKVQNHKQLTSQGRKDLSTLAERLRRRFPEFFNANKPENYEFTSTDTQRTIASMSSFIKGGFGSDFAANTHINGTEKVIVETIRNCQSWVNGTKADKVMQEFKEGPEVAQVIANVSRRLGFANNIKMDDIDFLYNLCRYEQAWYLDRLSPWCAAFTEDEERVLLYMEDLVFYYHIGYGMDINKRFGCRTVLDMFDRFAKLEHAEDTDEPKGLFHFSHTTQMMLFFTAMGIGKDTVPLTSENYKDMANRKWKMSLLSPFASNIVAVFYKCESEDSPYKVAFYLSEYPLTLKLEGCENGVCDWAKLKETLRPVVENCDVVHCRLGSH